jgi:AAA family ATP:ADP antiporter
MGHFSFYTGLATIFMVLFVSRAAINKSWGFAAMLTPIVLAVTGLGFFAVVLFGDTMTGVTAALGATPLFIAVMVGAAQNIMSKSTKYSLFDPTKEMAYIPLDQEQKVKGKAAIDVVGARLGKSGGSLIQQGLIITLGSVAAIGPFVAIALLIIIGAWLLAARSLNKQFVELTSPDKAAEAVESTEGEKVVEGEAQPATT